MRPFRWLLWGLVLSSIVATGYVASVRIGWEGGYRRVGLAVDWQEFEALGATEEFLPVLSKLGVRLLSVELKIDSEPKPPIGAAPPAGMGGPPGVEVETLKAAGFEPLYLLWDLHHHEPGELAGFLRQLAGLAPRVIIFRSEGRPLYTSAQLREIAHFVEEAHPLPLVGVVEFDTDPVVGFLHSRGFGRFVRVHEIEPAELEKLSPAEALARWERAVHERNIRLLLIHPFPASLSYNLAYLGELASRLRKRGYELALPPWPPDFQVASWLIFLVLIGPGALGILALERGLPRLGLGLRPRPQHWWALLGLVGLGAGLIALGLGVGPSRGVEMLRLAAAWGIAASVPLSGYLLLAPWVESGHNNGGLKRGLAALGAFSGLALLGGLWLGGSLSGVEFFLKLVQFRGVKAALVLPLVGVVLLWCARHGPGPLARLLTRRVSLGELALVGLGGLIILVVLLRSENASLIPAFELEERVREWLERLFWARPRFKEFLIGHPLLLLWGARAPRLEEWGYSPLILALGLIGQVSIINSFAHLHTPLLVSLVRTVGGLVLGGALGLLLYGLVIWGERAWQRLRS